MRSGIQTVATRLDVNTSAEDVVGRYGGEEFAIILSATGEQAPKVAERLRRAIADDPIQTTAGPVRVTISIGVSALAPTDATVSALLARADRGLYTAKRAGRNRVELADP